MGPKFAQFFPLVSFSYAESLLEPMAGASDDATAVISRRAYGPRESLTRGELRARARCLAASLRRMRIGPGDSVIASTSNDIELLVCALARGTIGATFSGAANGHGRPVPSLSRSRPGTVLTKADYSETSSEAAESHCVRRQLSSGRSEGSCAGSPHSRTLWP